MEKIVLLAAMPGLVATLSTKGAETKKNWDTLCAKCHGADGKGVTKIGVQLGCKDFYRSQSPSRHQGTRGLHSLLEKTN
jgi:cytochrome c553